MTSLQCGRIELHYVANTYIPLTYSILIEQLSLYWGYSVTRAMDLSVIIAYDLSYYIAIIGNLKFIDY